MFPKDCGIGGLTVGAQICIEPRLDRSGACVPYDTCTMDYIRILNVLVVGELEGVVQFILHQGLPPLFGVQWNDLTVLGSQDIVPSPHCITLHVS